MKTKTVIPQPITKGAAKVPVVLQLEAMECGAACLTMVLAYYDKWIPLEQVRKDCGVSRDGASAINIVKAAVNYGMTPKAFRTEPEQLKKTGKFPCIIHWNFNHFVVLDGFKGKKVYLNDPAKGAYAVSEEVFDESFTGICLMLEPGEQFVPTGKPKSVWQSIGKRLNGLKVPILITVITTVIASLLGVINPVFSRVFYDRLLTGRNPEWFRPFILGLAALNIVQLAAAAINASTSLRINGKIDLVGNLSFMWKVLHLPVSFFSQRMTGDIASRRSGNATIAGTLVNTLSPLVLNVGMMIFYLAVMLKYSWVLTLVGVSSSAINMLITNRINRRRLNANRVLARDSGKLYGATVAGIQMIETIKSSGAEEGFFERWSGYYAAVNRGSQNIALQGELQNLIPALVSSVSGNVILGIGIYLVMKGDFTLGSIAAFQGFLNSFAAPVSQLIAADTTIQEMQTAMERIDDVMNYPDDPNVAELTPKADEEISKLSGAVEVRNVSFGYSPLAKPLISDFSVSIRPGEHIAFVGPSGCGKSTLSKLITGLYTPWSGDILFDGKHINEIDHSVFTGSVAVVDQDITMFEGTVADNIKMWDASIEDFEMILAARDAQMHYEIASKEGGYQHQMREGGKDFSGGQRQRLEIARVLAQEPNIVILDEATSALDAKTEYEVVKAIKDRGITCIIIAHRLSTIRDCSEIIVLDKGNVVERGTHETLMQLGGRYAELISNE